MDQIIDRKTKNFNGSLSMLVVLTAAASMFTFSASYGLAVAFGILCGLLFAAEVALILFQDRQPEKWSALVTRYSKSK